MYVIDWFLLHISFVSWKHWSDGVTEWDDVGCATYSHVFKTRFTAQRVSLYGWEVPFCRSTALISKIQESLDPSSPGKLRGLAGHHYIKELTKHLQ